jgi:hypothetical protein
MHNLRELNFNPGSTLIQYSEQLVPVDYVHPLAVGPVTEQCMTRRQNKPLVLGWFRLGRLFPA